MSFRKRNVVLSAASSGEPSPRQPEAKTPADQQGYEGEALQQRRSLSSSQETTKGLPLRTSRDASQPLPPLDPPKWLVASRPELTPQKRAELEPAKQRLQAMLEQEKKKRARPAEAVHPLGPGARPSPFDGRPITSTGTSSLDQLLAGYGGLLLGHSLLVEEQGTTDFAGVLLRAYAAEGLVQGHHVHVLGLGPGWRTELPGLDSSSSSSSSGKQSHAAADPGDKMKIAWRYEALAARSGPSPSARGPPQGATPSGSSMPTFCHSFDLTKRLAPADIKGTLTPFPLPSPLRPSPEPEHVHSPLRKFLGTLKASLGSTPPSVIHRVVIPNFLAPTLYAMDGWSFPYVISLFIALRGLLREYSRRLTVVISLPTTLYERHNYYIGQLEKLCDNIVEILPLPPGPPSAALDKTRSSSSSSSKGSTDSDKSSADKMQGWLKVHKVQVYSEIGGTGASPQGKSLRENLCFTVSGSKGFLIMPFSLPPIEDENQKETSPASTIKDGIEF